MLTSKQRHPNSSPPKTSLTHASPVASPPYQQPISDHQSLELGRTAVQRHQAKTVGQIRPPLPRHSPHSPQLELGSRSPPEPLPDPLPRWIKKPRKKLSGSILNPVVFSILSRKFLLRYMRRTTSRHLRSSLFNRNWVVRRFLTMKSSKLRRWICS